MPRNGSGTYQVPNTLVTQTVIEVGPHNGNYSDLGAEISNSLALDGQSQMTGQFKAASGTVALPGISFGSDTDSGLYRIAGDNIGIAVGGTKVVDLTPTGVDIPGTMTNSGVTRTVPVGAIMDFAGSTAPANWLLCYGQAVSRSTYAALFAVLGTSHGTGDGSTTFNLPDCRGRVAAGKDDMGGSSANRLTNQSGGLDGDVLGTTGGSETHTLTSGQLAAHTHGAGTLAADSGGAHTHSYTRPNPIDGSGVHPTGSGRGDPTTSTSDTTGSSGAHTHTISGTSGSTGSDTAHNNVQPTIILNKIIFAGA
jgi:microcystin-dependent protein